MIRVSPNSTYHPYKEDKVYRKKPREGSIWIWGLELDGHYQSGPRLRADSAKASERSGFCPHFLFPAVVEYTVIF